MTADGVSPPTVPRSPGNSSPPTVLLRCETSKKAEPLVLRNKNAVLRRQLQGRVRYEPADRLWLAVMLLAQENPR